MIGRIVVTNVQPLIDNGAFPVKAISLTPVTVSATIFREGHEPVASHAVLCRPDGTAAQRVPMTAVKNTPHRFEAQVLPDSPGLWSWWIESSSGDIDGSPFITCTTAGGRLDVARPLAGFTAWYEFFPRSEGAHRDTSGEWVSGTLRAATRRLPDIATMGFDVVYLPPVNPIGVTKRKGRNDTAEAGPDDPGSPWGIGSPAGGHDAIHPDLGSTDDYRAFIEAARNVGLEVAFDIALQCSPDHPWVIEHPEWFVRNRDGSIACATNPPKVYEDIYPLNFDCDPGGLYDEILRIFKFWIDCGVTIFRCDNSHTKPPQFWQRLIADVKAERPDIIFNSEGLSHPEMMRTLDKVGFDNSYTRLPWIDGKQALIDFFSRDARDADVLRPLNWTANPDILPTFLQGAPREAFAVRAAIAALLSPGWAVYSGYELFENTPRHEGSVEYLDSEKYEYRPRNWDAVHRNPAETLVPFITELNRVRRENPALQQMRNLVFHETSSDDLLAFSKSVPGNTVLGVIALRWDRVCAGTVFWDSRAWSSHVEAPTTGIDAFSGAALSLDSRMCLAPQSPAMLLRLA